MGSSIEVSAEGDGRLQNRRLQIRAEAQNIESGQNDPLGQNSESGQNGESGESDKRRFFGARERVVLYAASEGCCESCGSALAPGFHMDHVRPYKYGGRTDVANAEALCPGCNRRKAAKTGIDAKTGITSKTGIEAKIPVHPSTVLDPLTVLYTPDVSVQRANMSVERALDQRANTMEPTVLPAWSAPMRPWQEQGRQVWHARRREGQNNVLVTACPASGKTRFACRIAHDEVSSGRIDRIVIVVPSLTLKSQWSRDAAAFGLRLTAGWGNGSVGLPADVHGCVVTYAQIAALPESVRLLCARHRVLAILDEIHHAGDGLDWGSGLRQAFEHACARLSLSGTPWRGDVGTIPFVTYDADGIAAADVSYPYADALRDGIVRELYFFTLGGQVCWLDGSGETHATFDDRLDLSGQSKRLRAALDAQGGWLPAVMTRAEEALVETRRTHPGAKGLVVCMDAHHARATAGLLARLTGERPALALSDDPDAAAVLDRFRRDPAKWLVVCRMAGEGYDNPRLRVVVWASSVVSELYFRQVTARAVRVVPGLPYQDAQVFLPADLRLLAMARAFLSERAKALGRPQAPRLGVASGDGSRPLFVALESRVTGTEAAVTGGEFIPEEALLRARLLKASRPGLSHMPEHAVAAVLTQLGPEALAQLGTGALADLSSSGLHAAASGLSPATSELAPAVSGGVKTPDRTDTPGGAIEALAGDWVPARDAEEEATYDEKRHRLRQNCVRLAGQVARAAGVPIEVVHRSCHRKLGFRQTEASIAQLERKERVLKKKLLELNGKSLE